MSSLPGEVAGPHCTGLQLRSLWAVLDRARHLPGAIIETLMEKKELKIYFLFVSLHLVFFLNKIKLEMLDQNELFTQY